MARSRTPRSVQRARLRAKYADARRSPGRAMLAPVASVGHETLPDGTGVSATVRLDTNPNRGKRHDAARATATHEPHGDERDQPYRPLTVTTPARNERGNVDRRYRPSSYTV